MRRRFTSEDDEAQIDLTPMLDVVFIMLIFFIVTSSFIRESGINVSRPESETSQQNKNDKKNLLISINAAGQIFFNREPRVIDVGSVRANIERFIAANNDASVIIQAEEGAKVGLYTQVHDAASLAQAESIVLVTGG